MMKGLHRIVLFCKDTEASKEWYTRAGFTYKHGHEGMHWFSLGDGELMLHPGEPGDGDGPSIHMRVDDLDGLFSQMKQAGLEPMDHQSPGVALEAPVVRPWGERVFELDDPDGHRWSFTESPET